MKIYLSGFSAANEKDVEGQERRWFKMTGCTARCYSFLFVCPGTVYYSPRIETSLKVAVDLGINIMMDSGAFSFHQWARKTSGTRSKGKVYTPEEVIEKREATIALYVDYCKKKYRDWDFYVNFDYAPKAPIALKMQRRLMRLGLKPIPVYHGDVSLDRVREYADMGFDLLGLGSGKEARSKWRNKLYFYDAVFEEAEKLGIKLHGFAVTKPSLMTEYPWYSCDSATWGVQATMGGIISFDVRRRVWSSIHVSQRDAPGAASYNRMDPEVQRELRETVESRGFSFDRMRTEGSVGGWERAAYNAWMFAHLEDQEFFGKEKRGGSVWEKLL